MIVALTGYARSGKDTVGRILIDHHGFERRAFGDVLKAVAVRLDPIIEVQSNLDPAPYKARLSEIRHLYCTDDWEQLKDEVPPTRQFLVDLGNALRAEVPGIEVSAALAGTTESDDIVVTNVYHPEEIEEFRERGALVARVERPGIRPANADEARTGTHPVDALIHNDGSLADLEAEVARLLDYHREG